MCMCFECVAEAESREAYKDYLRRKNQMAKTIEVETRKCPVCHKTATLTLPQDDYIAWKRGTPIQNALPDLSIDDRERLITGLHGECREKFLGPDPDEVDLTKDEDISLDRDEGLGGPGPEDKDQDEEPTDEEIETQLETVDPADEPEPRPNVSHDDEPDDAA